MLVSTINNISTDYNKEMHSLIEPDMGEHWAIRYVWIQHKVDNTAFLNNYFNPIPGNAPGLNVRKNTTHLQSFWNIHNKIFDLSALNGDLVYRIKIFNEISESIDYIEIWRNVDIIKKYFFLEQDNVVLSDGTVWTLNDKLSLANGVYDSGFISRNWIPIPTISKRVALNYYKLFVKQAQEHKKCIINTRFNLELHPLHLS